ncbi:hypothetical protein TraAM80_03299 [Trypanosoma rangeli]|uniref:Uncharacterized protein n=1 Tax=Trypanosoma rangeli TaxID=5698 RepID=A0A3R7NTT7_TRYRA|nr:uncharacterized protein TraAM80_03299 [Trypanosoma rangeli]RNF07555.1 hypothetical protein TraAM80_03299 [Trypanosoma rangeli]|eukprot:RNF07555.1 hypothetical protein TraAM80_03299 [Trypanosoma rangeli]
MEFGLAFFQAIDASSLVPVPLIFVIAELLGAVFLIVCLGVLLRVVPPCWERHKPALTQKWLLHGSATRIRLAPKKDCGVTVVKGAAPPQPTLTGAKEPVAPSGESMSSVKKRVEATVSVSDETSLDNYIDTFFSEAQLLDDALLSTVLSDATAAPTRAASGGFRAAAAARGRMWDFGDGD